MSRELVRQLSGPIEEPAACVPDSWLIVHISYESYLLEVCCLLQAVIATMRAWFNPSWDLFGPSWDPFCI